MADTKDRVAFANAPVSSAVHARSRLQSVDALRGLVIIIMALDHVRAYFSNARFDPLDLSQTDAALFLSRWITHLCAPTFLFLAGISAYPVSRRVELGQLQRFLSTRGLWLILLEFTVVQFGWDFNFRYEWACSRRSSGPSVLQCLSSPHLCDCRNGLSRRAA